MTGIPVHPVYPYPPDPKAGPAPPQPGFMYPPSGPAPQYPLYPAGPPIYNPAGKGAIWAPHSCLPPPLAPGPPLPISLKFSFQNFPSSPWKPRLALPIVLHTLGMGAVLPVPTDLPPVSLAFSSSPLYATTAFLPRSLKNWSWLCCPFSDASLGDAPSCTCIQPWGWVGGLLVTRPQTKLHPGPCWRQNPREVERELSWH